jgi:hypothetical protein
MLTPAPGQTLADTVAAAARGMDPAEPIVFMRHLGDNDVFHRGAKPGGVLIVVPGIWTGMPPALLSAMRARRACSTTGRCQICGECASVATGTFPHESWCPVSDDVLWRLYGAWARRVGDYARGRRIEEIPGSATSPGPQ